LAQVVTQEQIDSILEVISPVLKKNRNLDSPTFQNRAVSTYDFRHRNRLKRETRKIIERIHDGFAREFAIYLNTKLQTNIKVLLTSVYQFTVEEFQEVLQNPTCLYVMQLSPQQRSTVFEIRQNLAFYIVDRILGGPGNTNHSARELTKIEQNILSRLVEDILSDFLSAWEKTATFDIKLQSYFSSGNYLQFVRRGDSVVSVAFEINIDDKVHLKNMFNITYPYFLIEELIPNISLEIEEVKIHSTDSERLLIEKNIESIATPVVVKLGQSVLSIEEIMNLQLGDVVMLNKRVDDDLELSIGKGANFLGRSGMVRDQLAFKVTQKLSK